MAWFSEVQKQYGDDLIVLLDEPGLSLHGKAQGDLLRYIKEELLPKYQVIYTTHSPFMVDPANLMSCRTVEDVTGPKPKEEILGTKVGDDVLSRDRDTLFPLQGALGYDLTQSLFIGENCLLVEGPSDLLYLQWFSDQLRRAKRASLDKRWAITPCGGIGKVAGFMTLFGGNRLNVAILTDYKPGDKTKIRDLRESKLLRDGHLLTADMFVTGKTEADTEDIIGREMYVALVNAAYELKTNQAIPVAAKAGSPERVVAEIEDHFRSLPDTVPEFDHFRPSAFLVESGTGATLPGIAGALDRFEALFTEVNKLLPA